MIVERTIDGMKAVVAFINARHELVSEDVAEFAKVIFPNGDLAYIDLSEEDISEDDDGSDINIVIDGADGSHGFIDKDWDESKHSRGQPENAGQFGPGGGGAGSKVWKNARAIAALMEKGEKKPEKPKHDLNPKVVDVGGDEWNQQTAIRLETEYQTARPALDEMLVRYEKGDEREDIDKDMDEDLDEDEEEDHGEYEGIPEPESWDMLSDDAQSQIAEEYYSKAIDDYVSQEVDSWKESGGALDQAKSEIAEDPSEFLEDTLKEYVEREEEIPGDTQKSKEGTISRWETVRAPDGTQLFTPKNLAQAIELDYNSDGEGSGKLTITWNDEFLHGLRSDFDDPDQMKLEGVEEKDYSKLLTKEMRAEIRTVLIGEFESQAESKADDLEPPDFTDSAKEYMQENWDHNMDDEEKYSWAKYNTSIINDQQEEFDKQYAEWEGGGNVPMAGTISLPNKYDPLNTTSGEDYKRTQALARRMSLDRAAVVMKERDVKFGAGVDPAQAIRRIDNELWVAWKASSTSEEGQLLQVAVADELGGRLNPKTGRGGKIELDKEKIRKKADREYTSTGGYDGIKAYVRAKWETTQFLLEKADLNELELYRGIVLDPDKYEEAVRSHEVEGGYKKVSNLKVVRNGAASTTFNADIANGWSSDDTRIVLRALMPRTAAISIPAYGINVKSEQEVVVAGTAWKKWDAWIKKAPRIGDVKMAA